MLTDKQTRFIREYLRAPNDPTGAALRAGYSPGRARRQAREMLVGDVAGKIREGLSGLTGGPAE